MSKHATVTAPPASAASPNESVQAHGAIASQQPALAVDSRREVAIGDLRWQRIAEAAYYRAEQRGFAPGYELEDWLAAEAQVNAGPSTART